MVKHGDIIGEKVRAFLHKENLSQTEFGIKVGLKHPVINRITKNDLNNPEYKTLAAIAKGLEIEVWQLLQPPTTPELQKTGPKPVSDSRLAVLGYLIVELTKLKEDELRAAADHLAALGLVDGATDSSQPEKIRHSEG